MEPTQSSNTQGKKQMSEPTRNNDKKRFRHNKEDKHENDSNKPEKILKYHSVNFKFNTQTVEHLFFKKVNRNLLEDIKTYMGIPANKRPANEIIKSFFNDKKNLEDAASCAHTILEDLTFKCPQPKVPRSIIFTFLNILKHNKQKITTLLNQKGGDKLLDLIPLQYLVDVIEAFNIHLTRKDAIIFFKQLAQSTSFSEIPSFIKITGYDFEKELVPVIQRLITEKQYKKLRMIPNLKNMFKENKILAQEKSKMLKNTAFYQFRQEGWEYLQEIFEYHPVVIASIINRNFGSKPTKFQYDQKYLQGVVSICERNPKVFQRLQRDTKKVIVQKKQQMLKDGIPIPDNFLRINNFMPSSKDHFDFDQFKITKDHVIWVDDKLDNEKIRQIKQSILKSERIAIDTQSTLVRTPIDLDSDVLSLIQLSTNDSIYLFDPYNSKHPEIKAFFKAYFSDKQKTVIGHTIQDDIQGVAHFFQLPRPICKVIDIRTQYQKFKETNRQISLKAISKEILGKQICKKYTMTNWDRRPLNMCQIHYAAMDAYIILKIWDKLSLLIEEKAKNPQKFKKIKQSKQIKEQQKQKQKQQSNVTNHYDDQTREQQAKKTNLEFDETRQNIQ